jgi:hypothetical protein
MVTQELDGLGSAGFRSAAGLLSSSADRRQAAGRVAETVATGFPSLDRLLLAGGVRRGSLIELLAGGVELLAGGDTDAGDAAGAISLACAVACRLATSASQASTIVVVDRGQRFYPPAVIPWLDAQADVTGRGGRQPQLVVVRPSRDDDELWAIDQSLRCPGVAAVLAWPRRVHATAMRRWQLAARSSGAVGLWVRGLSERWPVAGGPTWADAKVAVSPVVGEPDADLAVRRLRLALVGGPWAGDEMLQERSTELLLDLTSGREATGRHRMPVRPATPVAPVAPVATGHFQAGPFRAGRFPSQEVACRAS